MVGQRRECECAALGLVPVDVWLPQRGLPSCGMFFLHVLFSVFVFSSDLDTDDDLNSDDYEYEDEAKLVIFPDHYEIALPNIEELPALVSECARLLARCAWLSVSGVCACAVCVHVGWGRRAECEKRRRMGTDTSTALLLCEEGSQGSVSGAWLLAACDSQSVA